MLNRRRAQDNERVVQVWLTDAGRELPQKSGYLDQMLGQRLGQLEQGLEKQLAPLSFRGATYSGIFTLLPHLTGEQRGHHGEILAESTKLAEAGELVPALDPHRFTLASADDAYRAAEAGTTRGKLVIDAAEEDTH